MDVDAAIRNALDNRTDLAQAHREMDQTDITMKFARNQKLPAVERHRQLRPGRRWPARARFTTLPAVSRRRRAVAQRSFSDALQDIFGNDFKTWSVQFHVSYPIGTSAADAGSPRRRCSANSR